MAAFSSLTDRLSNAFKHLKSKGKLSEADIDGTIREIRRALLDADVALDVVRSFTARIRERALGTEVSEALNPAQQVVKIVNEELTDVLGQGVDRPLNFAKNPPTIIMLAGLQGAGKTTLAGKLGYWLKDSGHTPLLVAADLQRPNAVTQLQVVGERAGVPVYAPEKGVQSDGGDSVSAPGETSGDPVKVARDSIALAKQKLYDTVIIDTAGRLGVDEVLMQQARDIRDAVNPNEILFVIDAMIGQDAVQTAKAFDEGVDFTGVVLSKLDGDARGGAALSVASVTGKPILFASTGEGLKDFEVFHPDRMASRILDMGDILTLIEQAQKQFDEEEARKAAQKMAEGEFGLDDFMDQLQQVRKLGSMKSLLGMIPGMAQHRKELEQFDEKEIDRTEAIIRSMTPEERRNPKIIDGSRRARIAYGSGVTVSAVNGLLQRFEQAAKMMKRMSNKAMGGIPGFRRPRGRRRQEGQGQEQEEGLEVRQSDEARGRGEGVARQARRQGLRFRQVRRVRLHEEAAESGSSGRAAGCARREWWRASAQLRRRPFRSARLIRPVFSGAGRGWTFSAIPARRQIICHIFTAFHSPRIRNGCRYTESHYSLVGMLGKEFGGGRVVVDTAGGVHAMVGVAVPASRTGSAHADDALHDCADSFFVDTVPGHRGMGRSGRLVVAVRRRRRRHRVDTCHAGSVLDEHATGTMAPPAWNIL